MNTKKLSNRNLTSKEGLINLTKFAEELGLMNRPFIEVLRLYL